MLFGSWCVQFGNSWSVKPLYNIRFHHANTRRKENRVRPILKNIKCSTLDLSNVRKIATCLCIEMPVVIVFVSVLNHFGP